MGGDEVAKPEELKPETRKAESEDEILGERAANSRFKNDEPLHLHNAAQQVLRLATDFELT